MATTPPGNTPSAHAGDNDDKDHDAGGGANEGKSSVASSSLEPHLRSPTAELTVEERVEILTSCAQLGEAAAAALHGCDAVLVLGDARVGKSTFISYLAGCGLEPRSARALGLPGSRKRVCVKADSVVPETVPIRHEASNVTDAKATHPTVVRCALEAGHVATRLAFCEAPILSHTRAAEFDIASAANLRRALARASSVRVVLLVSFHALRADRTRCMAELLEICEGLLGGPSRAGVHARSCLLGVTHVPVGGDEEVSLTSLREELEMPPLPGLLETLVPRLFVYDPLDRDAMQGALDRQGCLRALQELAPLKSEDGLAFQLRAPWRAQDQEHLAALVQAIGADALAALERGEAAGAAEVWHCLQRLGILHLDLVADAARKTRSRLVRTLRAAANGVREACALGDFATAESALELLEKVQGCGSFQDDVIREILEETDKLGRFLTRMKQRASEAEARDKEMAREVADRRRNCDELEERIRAQEEQIKAMAKTLAAVERPFWEAKGQHATFPPATSPPATSPPVTSPPATSPPATSLPATLDESRAGLQAHKAELEQQLAEMQRQHVQDNEAFEKQQAVAAVAAVERREAMEQEQTSRLDEEKEPASSPHPGSEARAQELGVARPQMDADLSGDLESARAEPQRLAAEVEKARVAQRAEQDEVLASLRSAIEAINDRLAAEGARGLPHVVEGLPSGGFAQEAIRAVKDGAHASADQVQEVLQYLRELPKEASAVRDALLSVGVADWIAAVMKAHPGHAGVQEQACAALRALATNGDAIRDAFAAAGAAQHLVVAMRAYNENPDVQRQACGAIWDLTNGNRLCRKALMKAGAPNAIVAAMQSHQESTSIQRLACGAISNLANRHASFRDALVAAGAPGMIAGAMRIHPAHAELQRVACGAISNLAIESASRQETLVATGAASEIAAALANHLDHARLQLAACGAVLNLAMDSGASRDGLMAAGMADRIVAAMRRHPEYAELQRLACAAIQQLAKDNVVHRATLVDAGAVEQIDAAVSAHGDTGNVRRSAAGATETLLGAPFWRRSWR